MGKIISLNHGQDPLSVISLTGIFYLYLNLASICTCAKHILPPPPPHTHTDTHVETLVHTDTLTHNSVPVRPFPPSPQQHEE